MAKTQAFADKDLFIPSKSEGFVGDTWDEYITNVLEMKGMPARGNFDPYSKFYRLKPWRIYDTPQEIGKEFLFFVKPDLYIADAAFALGQKPTLQPNVQDYPFFKELADKWPNVILQLQAHADTENYPYSLLLSNMVDSNLDLPSLSANTVTTPTNIFGTNYEYRGTSEPSDDNYDFSLEFADTRWLDVYMYFRTYEEYERLKAQGVINLNQSRDDSAFNKRSKSTFADWYKNYIDYKILHDQIGIYKFIVGEDFETIIYYAYLTGVMWKSLPRDSFNSPDFTDGIKYGIDAKAAFVDDDPIILKDFQLLNMSYINHIGVDNFEYAPIVDYYKGSDADYTPVSIPCIYQSTLHGHKVYKLKFLRNKKISKGVVYG